MQAQRKYAPGQEPWYWQCVVMWEVRFQFVVIAGFQLEAGVRWSCSPSTVLPLVEQHHLSLQNFAGCLYAMPRFAPD